MKKIVNDIAGKRNLPESLKAYGDKMQELYGSYALVRLSMNYFTLYEVIEEDKTQDRQVLELAEEIGSLMECIIGTEIAEEESEALIKRTDGLRNRVMNAVDALTSYADIFSIYEYCHNRTEPERENEDLKLTDEEIAKEIMEYILMDSDNASINRRITDVLRLVPMRMTKGRFFDLIRDALKKYKDSDKIGFDNLLYMIKTASMVKVSPYIEELPEDLTELYDTFRHTSFGEITETEHRELGKRMAAVSGHVMDLLSVYMLFGEAVNDLYVVFLSGLPRTEYTEESLVSRSIIKKVRERFLAGEEYYENAESIEAEFTKLEGKQESLGAQIAGADYMIEQAPDEYPEILLEHGLTETYKRLKRISLLESGSLFAPLDAENEGMADGAYIGAATEEYTKELSELFAKNEKAVNRAVMSFTLASLPIFFNDLDEVREYVLHSLGQCKSKAEKAAVTDILRQLKEEEV